VSEEEAMSTGALWAVFLIILINTLFLAGIAGALWFLNAKLNQLLAKAQPLVDRAAETLQNVEQITVKLNDRVNQILDRTGEVVEDVSQKVETTTSIAEETISQPLISAASLMAGISRGLSAYKEVQGKGDSN
jgi:uncharacterized protein YoxC